jgi:hypothetical protein
MFFALSSAQGIPILKICMNQVLKYILTDTETNTDISARFAAFN